MGWGSFCVWNRWILCEIHEQGDAHGENASFTCKIKAFRHFRVRKKPIFPLYKYHIFLKICFYEGYDLQIFQMEENLPCKKKKGGSIYL